MLELLHPPTHGSVYLIGGGGKTTIMFRLAAELAKLGGRVVTTTSTKIFEPAGEGRTAISPSMAALLQELEIRNGERVTVARGYDPSFSHPDRRKLLGFSIEDLDRMQQSGIATAIIVEADGSAGRSLKAHAPHEPVVSARADLVVAVVGIDCIGRTLDDRHVHRSGLLANRLSLIPGTIIEPAHVARILLHPQGYLEKVSRGARAVVAITKVSSAEEREQAAILARTIRAMDSERRVDEIMIMDHLP